MDRSAEVDHLIDRVRRSPAPMAPPCVPRIDRRRRSGCAFWAGRKAAFPAVGRISPDYLCMDGTIPRRKLPASAARHGGAVASNTACAVANVFHAGDGNLHPLILFDANKPEELDRAEEFGADILRLCVKVGGVLTGEHGVGVEKRDLMPEMFSEADLDAAGAAQMRLRCQGPAQSRQGVPGAASLRRARPHACAPVANCPSPKFRGSEDVTELKPEDQIELTDAILTAIADKTPMEIVGSGTMRAVGRPLAVPAKLDLSGLTGLNFYEPEELVLSAKAGTPAQRDRRAARCPSPGFRLRASRFRPASRQQRGRYSRRHDRRQSVGTAPHQVRRPARPHSRIFGCLGSWRNPSSAAAG